MARPRCWFSLAGMVLVGAQLLARQGWGAASVSETMRRMVVLARVISYEEQLKERVGSRVGMVVLFRSGNATSEAEASALVTAGRKLENISVEGLPFQVRGLAFTDAAALEAAVQQNGYDAVYVCAGLEPQLRAIKQVTRKRQIISMAGNAALMSLGVSVAVEAQDQTRIFIHLSEAKSEGVAFETPLLRVAQIVR